MALLSNDNTKRTVGSDIADQGALQEDSNLNILDLDAELSKEKAMANLDDDSDLEKVEDKGAPMKPGAGKVGDINKRSGMAKAPLPKKEVKQEEAMSGGGLGAFSLLPLDEEGILYHDLPRAIRKLLYVLVFGAILVLAAWYFSSDFLGKYMQEANNLQGEIRTINAEKVKYKVTDADLRVNYQYYQLVKNLLYNHITWTKFFNFLEQFTVPEVYYTNFSVNAVIDDTIIFDAVALDLKSALKQYLVLKQYAGDYIDSVEMTSLTLVNSGEDNGDQSATFNISFKLKPHIFRLKTNEEE